ncbi:MAG: tripartite tricarboxylate transporter TctB family protein [Pseudomonadota bacterium]
MNSFTRKGDFWAGLALAALGIFIVSQAWGWSYMTEEGPGPGFFPLWYGTVMVVLSLLLTAGTVLKHDPRGKSKVIRWDELRRAMTCWAALAVCVAIIKFVGFMIAFGLLTWFIVAIMFRRSQKEALAYAVGGAVGFYALFSWALELQLPVGTLF